MIFNSIKNPDQKIIDQLRVALDAYNTSITNKGDRNSIYIYVEDENGNLIGGIYGKIAWNWLYIDLLWVHPNHRNNGFGTQLIKAIEKEAQKSSVYSYHLRTTSFQAPIFYQKLGYQICGEIEDLPPNYTTYFLKKQD
jgi:ribosomal protein S18 acetylase RimI-like enzyme